MIVVLDTSVAIKWFVDEPGPSREQALIVLDQVKLNPTGFAVPELFFNEILAVLCRVVGHADEIKTYIGILGELGLERIANGRGLLCAAAEIAKRYKVSGYDAVFAATAQLISGSWLTADDVAVKKLRGSGLARLLF